MLFMKGTPSAPPMRFSPAKTVSMLREKGRQNTVFFNILADDEVRPGDSKSIAIGRLFPQLYCRGELVGGVGYCLRRSLRTIRSFMREFSVHAAMA